MPVGLVSAVAPFSTVVRIITPDVAFVLGMRLVLSCPSLLRFGWAFVWLLLSAHLHVYMSDSALPLCIYLFFNSIAAADCAFLYAHSDWLINGPCHYTTPQCLTVLHEPSKARLARLNVYVCSTIVYIAFGLYV